VGAAWDLQLGHEAQSLASHGGWQADSCMLQRATTGQVLCQLQGLVLRAALVKCSCTCTLVPRSIVRAFLIEEQKVVKKVCEGLGWGRLQRMWW
jgi:hypothetical protein